MEWEDEYVPLDQFFLSDVEYEYLLNRYPDLRSKDCPTCGGGARAYLWDGEFHECDCSRQRRLNLFYLAANIGELYQRLSWDDYQADQKLKEFAIRYLKGRDQLMRAGIGMLIAGPFGTGKTMISALVAKELVKLGVDVYFTTFPEMVDQFTKGWGDNTERQRFERKIVESQMLVLDDVGKEFRTKTNLAESTFDHILRQRVIGLRPTILTTNMKTNELSEGYGGAILSLLEERSVQIWVEGADWRKHARLRAVEEAHKGWVRPIT